MQPGGRDGRRLARQERKDDGVEHDRHHEGAEHVVAVKVCKVPPAGGKLR